MSNSRILVTGANGLLGRHISEAFNTEYDIHALVREMPVNPVANVTYHVSDFTSDWSTNRLPDNIHTIFHLAQSEHFRDFPEHALDVFNVNVTSTVKLLDYARRTGVKKFIFTSTGGLYETGIGAVTENSPVNTFGQLGNYFSTKLCSEIITHNYVKYFDIILLRLFFMYGRGQRRSMLIPRLIDNIKNKRPIKLSENGGIKINPVHVDDVVGVFKGLMSFDGNYTFNVAGPEELNIESIARIIGSQLGIEPVYEQTNDPGTDCIANIDLLSNLVRKPEIKFADRISELF